MQTGDSKAAEAALSNTKKSSATFFPDVHSKASDDTFWSADIQPKQESLRMSKFGRPSMGRRSMNSCWSDVDMGSLRTSQDISESLKGMHTGLCEGNWVPTQRLKIIPSYSK